MLPLSLTYDDLLRLLKYCGGVVLLGAWAAEGKSLTSASTARALNEHGHQLPPI